MYVTAARRLDVELSAAQRSRFDTLGRERTKILKPTVSAQVTALGLPAAHPLDASAEYRSDPRVDAMGADIERLGEQALKLGARESLELRKNLLVVIRRLPARILSLAQV